MSELDWRLVEAESPPAGSQSRKPVHDLPIEDGQTLTLGDTSVRLYFTPGHTAGTVSAVIPLRDHGKPHVAAYWGGTAIPANIKLVDQYLASVARFRKLALAAGVDVLISNHPSNDLTLVRLPLMATRKPWQAHPFVLGRAGYQRSLDVLDSCVRAVKAELPAAP